MTTLGRTPTRLLRDWIESIRRYGPLYLAAYLFDLLRVQRTERAEGFDMAFGTDTAAITYPWNLPSVRRNATSEVHAYEAAPVALIRAALAAVPLRPGVPTFVDLGSGKGRVLLVASHLPFAKIVGVELSAELQQVAEENIRRYRPADQRCKTISLLCMNATEYAFGPEPLVLFLHNPFGESTIRHVLTNLAASLRAMPRDAYVIYVNPRFEGLLRSARFLQRVGRGGSWWRPWSRYVVYAAECAPLGSCNMRHRGKARLGLDAGRPAGGNEL